MLKPTRQSPDRTSPGSRHLLTGWLGLVGLLLMLIAPAQAGPAPHSDGTDEEELILVAPPPERVAPTPAKQPGPTRPDGRTPAARKPAARMPASRMPAAPMPAARIPSSQPASGRKAASDSTAHPVQKRPAAMKPTAPTKTPKPKARPPIAPEAPAPIQIVPPPPITSATDARMRPSRQAGAALAATPVVAPRPEAKRSPKPVVKPTFAPQDPTARLPRPEARRPAPKAKLPNRIAPALKAALEVFSQVEEEATTTPAPKPVIQAPPQPPAASLPTPKPESKAPPTPEIVPVVRVAIPSQTPPVAAPRDEKKTVIAPTSTPIPEPAPAQKPAPTPEPAPAPEATPAPEPSPILEPAPSPEPPPAQKPAPAPKPAPSPEPAPAQKPAPILEPAPAPEPPPAPEPASIPRAIPPFPKPSPRSRTAPSLPRSDVAPLARVTKTRLGPLDINRVIALQEDGDFDGAIKETRRLVAGQAGTARGNQLRFFLAELLQRVGRFGEARTVYQEVLAEADATDVPAALFGIAQTSLALGDEWQARRTCSELARRAPASPLIEFVQFMAETAPDSQEARLAGFIDLALQTGATRPGTDPTTPSWTASPMETVSPPKPAQAAAPAVDKTSPPAGALPGESILENAPRP